MKAFLHSFVGVLVGALLVTGGAWAVQSWPGVPPLFQQLLNDRAGGETAYGSATVTCSTNGNFTITHGMTNTPVYAAIDPVADDATNGVEVQAIGATTLTGRCFTEADGADKTSGNLDVVWIAKAAI